MKQVGPWSVKASTVKYKNPWITVREDQVVRPDGKDGIYGVITTHPAVMVLALDDTGTAYFVQQFRYALEETTLEVCAGAVDEGETPLAAAKRELTEELGIEAKKWTDLGDVYPLASTIRAPQTLFLAQDLSFVKSSPEGTEIITTVTYDLRKALQMAMNGEIRHTPTCTLLLRTANLLGLLTIKDAKQVK